jgi:sialidase-1
MKKIFALVALALAAITTTTAVAQTAASAIESKKQTLFNSANHSSTPYRIPAIATLSNGDVIAIADQRPCGADVGNGDVDIYAKFSNNNGAKGSWTPENIDPSSQSDTPGRIANGGTGTSKGYGDAAVAADPSSGKVVFMCVGGGNTPFASAKTSTSDYLCIRNYSEDYGRTWTQTNVTSYFKGNNNVFGADVASMFFTLPMI